MLTDDINLKLKIFLKSNNKLMSCNFAHVVELLKIYILDRQIESLYLIERFSGAQAFRNL